MGCRRRHDAETRLPCTGKDMQHQMAGSESQRASRVVSAPMTSFVKRTAMLGNAPPMLRPDGQGALSGRDASS